MAKINHRAEIELTAVATTISLDVTDPYELYEIKTAAALSIIGTTAITTTGTLLEGTSFKFRYTAQIATGTVTIMGAAIPEHLLAKEMIIEAFYDGTVWTVDFYPSLDQDQVIKTSSLVTTPGTHVVSDFNTAAYVTVNIAGMQVLRTVVIPANTLLATGAGEGLRITARGTLASNVSKSLQIRAVGGVISKTIFRNNDTALDSFFDISIIVSAVPPGTYQSEGVCTGNGTPTMWTADGADWDFTIDQSIIFEAEENVLTGGLVTLRQLRVEKITI